MNCGVGVGIGRTTADKVSEGDSTIGGYIAVGSPIGYIATGLPVVGRLITPRPPIFKGGQTCVGNGVIQSNGYAGRPRRRFVVDDIIPRCFYRGPVE